MNSVYFESKRDSDDLFYIEKKVNDCYHAHFHSNIEVLYVLEGEIDVTVNDHCRTLKAGAMAISNSFDVHSYNTKKVSKTIFMVIPAETVPIYQKIIDNRHFETPFLVRGDHSKELENAVFYLLNYVGSDSLSLLGHIYVILGIALKKLTLCENDTEMSGGLIRSILLYLDKNYQKNIKLGKLSELFGYNRSYLSRVFNAYIGVGFNEYINRLRVRHSARLIQTTDMNMTQISEESGFSCVRSFNRTFMEQYGITPMKYKKHKTKPTESGSEIDKLFGVYSYTLE